MFLSILALIASNDEIFTARKVAHFQSEYGMDKSAKLDWGDVFPMEPEK